MFFNPLSLMPEPETPPTRRRTVLLLAVPLLLAVLFACGPVKHFDFVNWDDDLYVYHNPAIREISTANAVQWLTRPYVSLYVPLPMFSYALDYRFQGPGPEGFHRTNLFLHTANVLLLYFILTFFFKDPWLALPGALLFAVHPAQAETVAWISQRKSLLCAFFLLAGFYAYLRGAAQTRDRKWMTVAVVSFVLALLSKATAVMIPLVILAFDYFFRGTTGKRKGLLLSLFLLVPASAMVAFTLALYPELLSDTSLRQFSDYLLGQVKTFFFYAKHIFMPFPQHLAYENIYLLSPGPGERFLLAGGLLLFIAALTRITWKKQREGFWLWWYLLMLLPVVNVFRVPAADRHLYLPLAGVAGLLVSIASRRGRVGSLLIFCLAVVAFGGFRTRLPVWQNSEVLWKSVWNVKTSMGFMARMQLAGYYEDTGRWEEARDLYENLMQWKPLLPYPYLNLYNLYVLHGDEANAARVAEVFKRDYSARYGLAELYRNLVASKPHPEKVRQILIEVMGDHGVNNPDPFWMRFRWGGT